MRRGCFLFVRREAGEKLAAEPAGGNAVLAAEALDEIAAGGKTGGQRNFRDGILRGGQQNRRLFQPYLRQVFGKAFLRVSRADTSCM